jgi:hypothetical protein
LALNPARFFSHLHASPHGSADAYFLAQLAVKYAAEKTAVYSLTASAQVADGFKVK